MRRAGDRVFGNAERGKEAPADKVMLIARRRSEDTTQANLGERGEIRLQRFDLGLAGIDRQPIFTQQHLLRLPTQRTGDFRGRRDFGRVGLTRRLGREVHEVGTAFPADTQLPASRRENELGRFCSQLGIQHMCGRQSGMPAEIDLASGCKPAQRPIAILRKEEGRLAEVILDRDGKHHGIGQPRFERDDRRGIPRKDPFGKGIDLELRQFHAADGIRRRMILIAMRQLSPLLLLGLLPACSSDPVQHDLPPSRESVTPATVEPAIEHALDASFLLGAWAPYPDVPEIDLRIEAMIDSETPEDAAVMMTYLSRFFFNQDGSGAYGISARGEFSGDPFEWTVEQASAFELKLTLLQGGARIGEALSVTREGENMRIKGDPTIAGAWIPIQHGIEAEAEDEVFGGLGVQHLSYRKEQAIAAQQIEDVLEQRRDSFETLVTLVKTICEAEELTGNTSRNLPVRGRDYMDLRQGLTDQESTLMELPVKQAPQPPILAEHRDQARAFDEDWLDGTWKFQIESLDWDVIMPQVSPEMEPEIRKIVESRRRSFGIRGTYLNTIGSPEVLESLDGYYSLTPGAGNWVWITILEQRGSPDVGIVSQNIETFAAYRVGEVLWLEEGEGHLFPYLRVGPK